MRSRGTAFTLVELLVVIGIIGVLVSVLLPALAKARQQATQIKCSSQLRVIGQNLFIYAAANKGRAPMHEANVKWLWDMASLSRDALMGVTQKPTYDPATYKGASRDVLYCPEFDSQNVDGLWNLHPDYTVLGYFFYTFRLLPKPASGGAAPLFEQGMPLTARTYITSLNPRVSKAGAPTKPVEIEVASDPIVSMSPLLSGPWFASGEWVDRHNTPHMRKGIPTGSNTLYLDGHVAFKPFDKVRSVQPTPVNEPAGDVVRLRAISVYVRFWF